MRSMVLAACALGVWVGLAAAQDERAGAGAYAEALIGEVSAENLRGYHDWTAGEPHDAGTPGDRRLVEKLAETFGSFGLEVEKQAFDVYLPRPGEASVRVVAPEVVELALRERAVEGDEFSENQDLRGGWNAYSGSGDVTAGVVYVNYGRLEDFRKLEDLGVSCEGKIVVARYGGNFRGYKAKYAQEAGALGLIIYTDPEDAGYRKGLTYPRGGYANETSIQRGSIKTLDYVGDPLTPGEPAIDGVERLDPSEVGLPEIPVQPVGWGAAEEILSRMEGEEAPEEWQGGLALRYMVTGGDGLRVNLKVEQSRELTEIWNVVARLEGETYPDEEVFIGCHHDAWGYGASDPACGLICVIEAARAMARLAGEGMRPARSVVFCAWGAEEHGIIGSSEFVERDMKRLTEHAVAYINLDAAAMGPKFGANASPSLHDVIFAAAGQVPQARDDSVSVLEEWTARSGEGGPKIGDLGGGSDHVGFLCHACVPSMSLGGSGSRGTAYHTLYDDLAWYRAVVGEDYEPALMITRMTLAVAARLVSEGAAALRPEQYGQAIIDRLDQLEERIKRSEPFDESSRREILSNLEGLTVLAAQFEQVSAKLRESVAESHPDEESIRLREPIRTIERSWCDEMFGDFDGRPWFRNAYAGPDATSGYASWVLPGLEFALHEEDAEHFLMQHAMLARWIEGAINELGAALNNAKRRGP